MADPKVYDVTKAVFKVNGQEMVDVSPDGFGITPNTEHTLIEGLTGEQGFNRDPSTAGEATLSLKANSESNQFLEDLFREQRLGTTGPVSVEIAVDDDYTTAFGFKTKKMAFAFIQKPAAFESDGKESPTIEWTFIGYGYAETNA